MDVSPADRRQAEQAAEQLGASGADQAGDPQDLPATQREGGGSGLEGPGQVPDLQGDRPRPAIGPRVAGVDLASDHHADDLAGGQLAGVARADDAPVTENGHPIGDAADLVEEVRDIDDGVPGSLEAPDQGEEAFDVLLCKRAGGLVQDQHAAAHGQGPGDLDQLPVREAQLPDGRIRVQFRMLELPQRRQRPPPDLAGAEQSPSRGLHAEEDVLGDR